MYFDFIWTVPRQIKLLLRCRRNHIQTTSPQWNILEPDTLHSGSTLVGGSVTWEMEEDAPWCQAASIAQMVNGKKLFLRKVPQEQLVIHCELSLVKNSRFACTQWQGTW